MYNGNMAKTHEHKWGPWRYTGEIHYRDGVVKEYARYCDCGDVEYKEVKK